MKKQRKMKAKAVGKIGPSTFLTFQTAVHILNVCQSFVGSQAVAEEEQGTAILLGLIRAVAMHGCQMALDLPFIQKLVAEEYQWTSEWLAEMEAHDEPRGEGPS